MESTQTAQDAYTLQYVSLLMIILTFVVGALLRPPAPPPPKSPFARWEKPQKVGELTLSGLFTDPHGAFDRSRVAGIVELLRCHDIDAEISLYPRADVGDRANEVLGRGLAQAVSLSRYIESLGIPPGTFTVLARAPGSARGEIRVELMRSTYAKRHALF